MVEEPRTKAVFREMDGFLVMVGILSALAPLDDADDNVDNAEQRAEVIRLAFAIISEGMRDHRVNTIYFDVSFAQSVVLYSLNTGI